MSDNGVYPAETCTIFTNDKAAQNGTIRCDAIGCEESHPIDHENLGELGFELGRWIGWVYIDLNRPDLFDRQLRFCSVSCTQWWLDRQIVTRRGRPLNPLDVALSSPPNDLNRQAALRWLRGSS